MKSFIDTQIPNGLEEICKFLKTYDIDAKSINHKNGGYNRELHFKINDQDYIIQWWINNCYLKLGVDSRSSFIPFKYIYLDTTYPVVGGNKCLGFSQTMKEDNYDRFPFESFRIPLEVK